MLLSAGVPVSSVDGEGNTEFNQALMVFIPKKIDREINGRLRDEMPTLYDILIVQRNTAWTERLDEVMDEPGVVMVVVGAGHLAGADGVPVMLAARGYDVEQVTPTPTPAP